MLLKPYRLAFCILSISFLFAQVIETRVANLEKCIQAGDQAEVDKLTKELTDLKQLLPDIVAKVSHSQFMAGPHL